MRDAHARRPFHPIGIAGGPLPGERRDIMKRHTLKPHTQESRETADSAHRGVPRDSPSFPFDAAMVLGKELKRDPERARRELAARCAAAARAWHLGARHILTLEARLRGQSLSGSAIVAHNLRTLGIPDSAIVLRSQSRSTREEAIGAHHIAKMLNIKRLLVFTTSYHVARASHYFDLIFPPGQALVAPPEFVLEAASADERRWILRGLISAPAAANEARVEALFRTLAAFVDPIPGGWRLEMAAAAWLRKS